MNYVVIMAGGSGERFWPLSRRTNPKQLLSLTNPDLSMLQEAIQRIAPLVPVARILIVTSEVLRDPILKATPELSPENVIAEPAKRNTAPCLALAASVLQERDKEAVMAVLTADHFIGDEEAFRADVEKAMSYAAANDALVTLGIRPTRPESGYGYIEVATKNSHGVVPVSSFKEKPDASTALDYVNAGTYLWNSGMFFWSVKALRASMLQHLPEVGVFIDHPGDVVSTFASLPNISIDYGVMEQANNVFVLEASFPWDDIGSWDSLSRLRDSDALGNVVDGNVYLDDAFNNIVINASGKNHVVTALGVRDVVIVATKDATMIIPKSRAQDVKSIVQALRNNGNEDVL